MTVRFVNEPDYELLEKAVQRFAVAIAKNEHEKASEDSRKPQNDE